MTHAESKELLLDFAYGELQAQIAAEVEAHLASCDECRAEKQQLESVRKAFAPIRESEEPGLGFDERILAAARADAQLEHDGNIGEVVEVAASVAPSGLDAARVNAHAASVAPPARRRPKWMTRAALGGSVAAAAALALLVSTSVTTNRERQTAAPVSIFAIHVAPQSAPPMPEASKGTALAGKDAAQVQAPPPPAAPAAPIQVAEPAPDVRRRALVAAKKRARAIDEGSGGDVPNPAELALRGALAENESKAQAGGGVRAAASDGAAEPARDQPVAAAPESEAPSDKDVAITNSRVRSKEVAGAAAAAPPPQTMAPGLAEAAPKPENPGELERRAEAARHAGNYALAAGLYREAASGWENDSSAAAWDLAHAIECLAAAGSFDEARKVRDQLGKSYPAESTAFSAARRALREVDSNSPTK